LVLTLLVRSGGFIGHRRRGLDCRKGEAGRTSAVRCSTSGIGAGSGLRGWNS
jgi:hypothetical protein